MHEQLYEVDSIQFGVYSSDEIRKMSSFRVTSEKVAIKNRQEREDEIYITDNTDKSKVETVYDERSGPLNANEFCMTCKQSYYDCPGHFGHIELNIPILHPLFIKDVVNFLTCVCHYCSKPLITKESISLNNINKFRGIYYKHMLLEKIKKIDRCFYCKKVPPKIKSNTADDTISVSYKEGIHQINVELTPDEIYSIFDKVEDEDCILLGYNPKFVHPRNLIFRVFPVLPICSRPPVIGGGKFCDDDLSVQLMEIVKSNEKLENKTAEDKDYLTLRETLKFRIKTYMVNNKGKAKHPTNNRPIKCINSRLKGKDGLIRGNILGKRTNQSARTVIGPDPTLRMDQVAIPPEVAEVLTFPERVTNFNKDYLTNLINNNKAKYVIRKTTGDKTKKIDLKYALHKQQSQLLYGDKIYRKNTTNKKITKIKVLNTDNIILKKDDKIKRNGEFITDFTLKTPKKFNLEIGDIVERYLKDGDPVLFNRQPSLWRGSMLGLKVVVRKGKTFRINLANTNSLNADFDGKQPIIYNKILIIIAVNRELPSG